MNFEAFKNLSVWELLKFLENETKVNGRKIKENSIHIINLMNEQNKAEVERYQAINQKLVKQNADNIKLHNSLLNLYKSTKMVNEPLSIDAEELPSMPKKKEDLQSHFDDCFEKTIKDEIPFDSKHPFYCSVPFKEKLLQHYIALEAYEKCEMITNCKSC